MDETRTGKSKTYQALAERHGVSEMYVKRVMPLAYLAPAIVTAILNNQQPEALTKEDLMGKVKLPLCWIA